MAKIAIEFDADIDEEFTSLGTSSTRQILLGIAQIIRLLRKLLKQTEAKSLDVQFSKPTPK